MSSFSITAPQYTLEDEQRDRALLRPEELQLIEADIFGRSSDRMDDSDGSLQQAEDQLYARLQNTPEENKSAYLEARQKCPDLVEKESAPARFLRCTQNDDEVSWKSDDDFNDRLSFKH